MCGTEQTKYSIYPIQPALVVRNGYRYGTLGSLARHLPIMAFAIAPFLRPVSPNTARCYEPHVGVLASKCAEISVARVPLTFEVLDALREILEHLENVRMSTPRISLFPTSSSASVRRSLRLKNANAAAWRPDRT